METLTEPVRILLIDDDEIDCEAIERSFRQARIVNPLVRARDGLEGLEILRGENGREKLTGPYIVLLDINMPRMNGFEFLDAVRTDPDLKRAVIFVITTSDEDEDKMRAYNKNVAGYIVKKYAGREFLRAAEMLDRYWRIVELPKNM